MSRERHQNHTNYNEYKKFERSDLYADHQIVKTIRDKVDSKMPGIFKKIDSLTNPYADEMLEYDKKTRTTRSQVEQDFLETKI